jgi:hypothetical protein
MDWLVAGVFALIGLVGCAVIWIGKKNPKLKPTRPGITLYEGAFGLGRARPKGDRNSNAPNEIRQAGQNTRPPE